MIDAHMKECYESNEIQIHEIPRRPRDFYKIKKALLSGKLNDTETVSIGQNRGQSFVRLPTRMTSRMKLRTGDRMKITLSDCKKGSKMILELVRANA